MMRISSPRAGITVVALLALLESCTSSSITAPSPVTVWPDPPRATTLKAQLAAAEAKSGPDDPDLVEILLALGKAYASEGGYMPATPYVERALAITEKTDGAASLQVGATLDRLGTLYLAQGDTVRARAALTRAQPILLKELGEKNPGYGIFLLHLGELQVRTGETKAAQETIDQALTAFGDEISRAAYEWTEVNRVLGLLLLGVGRYQESEEQLVYALAVRSEAEGFGLRDDALFHMATVKNSLGELYVTVGRDAEAEPLLLDALSAYEKKYGPDHPLLEGVLVNLAALYEGRGDAAKRRQFAERSRALHQRTAGYSHLAAVPVRQIGRVTPPPASRVASADGAAAAPGPRLGTITTVAAAPEDPILLRMAAPVGRVTRYYTQTKTWLPGFPKDPAKPAMIMTDMATESITSVDGDVRTISTVVMSSLFEMPGTPQMGVGKDVTKGMTVVRRMDSRGRVLSTVITREAEGMRGQGPPAPHAASDFTLPEGPVRVGDMWTATETMPLGQGTGGRAATVLVTYRLERIGLNGTARVAVISLAGTVTGWLDPTGPDRRLVATQGPASGTVSGEMHLDLTAGWLVGLTMSLDDRGATERGIKTMMTTAAQ